MTVKHQIEESTSVKIDGAERARCDVEPQSLTMPQVRSILESWDLGQTQITLAAHRENTVYCVKTQSEKRYALRVRRTGHRSDAQIESELDWMAMLAREGMRVPLPVAAPGGYHLVRMGQHRADLVTWLDGSPLGKSGEPLLIQNAPCVFRALGRAAAQLHLLSDRWMKPSGFERPRWDADALLGETPLWGRFWDCPGLPSSDAALFTRVREAALLALADVHESLDIGLIHADLVRENVLLDPIESTAVALIDFDDGVIGYRLFEIATALGKNINEPEYSALRDALLDGYRELRPLDIRHLDVFMAVRAATYVGWSLARQSEPGGMARVERALCAARVAAEIWLDERRD